MCISSIADRVQLAYSSYITIADNCETDSDDNDVELQQTLQDISAVG